jgi:hypothetical protein
MLIPPSVDRHRTIGILHPWLIDPVREIRPCAGEADHLPAHHALVAAVDRIGKEALFRVVQQIGEERPGRYRIERELGVFHLAKHAFLVFLGEIGKCLAAILFAVLVASLHAETIYVARCEIHLEAKLCGHIGMKWPCMYQSLPCP